MFQKFTFVSWNGDWFWQDSPNKNILLCKSSISPRLTRLLNFLRFPFEDFTLRTLRTLTSKAISFAAQDKHGTEDSEDDSASGSAKARQRPKPCSFTWRFLECFAGKGEKGKERKKGEKREEGLWCQ